MIENCDTNICDKKKLSQYLWEKRCTLSLFPDFDGDCLVPLTVVCFGEMGPLEGNSTSLTWEDLVGLEVTLVEVKGALLGIGVTLLGEMGFF